LLTKPCAITLLVLALSPFTALFQTCDFADFVRGTSTDEPVMLPPPTVAQPSLSDDAGAVVPPRPTAAGRVRLAPVSELFISNVVARPPLTALAPPVTPPVTPPLDIADASFPPTVLRV
jgi:hypothetical protein